MVSYTVFFFVVRIFFFHFKWVSHTSYSLCYLLFFLASVCVFSSSVSVSFILILYFLLPSTCRSTVFLPRWMMLNECVCVCVCALVAVHHICIFFLFSLHGCKTRLSVYFAVELMFIIIWTNKVHLFLEEEKKNCIRQYSLSYPPLRFVSRIFVYVCASLLALTFWMSIAVDRW